MEKTYFTPKEVAEMLGCSVSTAYKTIRKLNKELEAQGFTTLCGRANRNYFIEKTCYGGLPPKEVH